MLVLLLSFISMVWLKDQVGNGRGPGWLENDQREANRMRMHEAQNRVQALRRHLEEAGERARERQNAPDRVAAAKELTNLYELLHGELRTLQLIQDSEFGERLDTMRRREMQLTYDLGMSQWQYQLTLKSARKKKTTGIEKWRTRMVEEAVESHRKEVGDPKSYPEPWPDVTKMVQPTDAELGLTVDESIALQIHNK